ncbi:Rieske (2Fe-2S) protein [Nocardioides stalactiti]|uniref:Rieske (2Fe-2S) protein n=1 Tax=Nocardioides stalactiti TaxID=2755356 RepID=UPI0016000196|nr:Rieske (2Fe-2S) protein [Nocardioides stalactiti]
MTTLRNARPTRRILFHGLGALGVAAALAGCGGDDGDGATPDLEAGTELTTTDEVPVGGGIILTEEKVVVTQPTAGEFKAFTAVCTHQQLTVTSVEDGVIHCDNHGSAYDAATGEVVQSPAPDPLASIAIEVRDGKILTV